MIDLELTERQKMYLSLGLMMLVAVSRFLGWNYKPKSKYGKVMERQKKKMMEKEAKTKKKNK